jgi:hypothetical protein
MHEVCAEANEKGGRGERHQESILALYSNKEISCASAPRRSPTDAFK